VQKIRLYFESVIYDIDHEYDLLLALMSRLWTGFSLGFSLGFFFESIANTIFITTQKNKRLKYKR
jgi:hypothetical protein